MADSIHGHEVMEMMLEMGDSFTERSLVEAIEAKFGAGARFHACSASNMTPAELVAFLKRKGKFTGSEDGFNTEKSRICGH